MNRKFSSDFKVGFNGEFVHVSLAPNFEISKESMGNIWSALFDACRKHQCTKVLIEGKAASRKMNVSEAYSLGTEIATITRLHIAFLYYDYKTDELTDFFKTVSKNRGVRIEFFSEKEKALQWLEVKEPSEKSKL